MENQEVSSTETEKTKEEFDVIKFFDLNKDNYDEDTVAVKIQNKLGTSLLQMKEAISSSVISRAEELSLDFINIAPLGNYGNLLEDSDSMINFLKTEGHKSEHWKLQNIFPNSINKELISFYFSNMAVDDGTTLKGIAFVTKSGKIKHAFAQVED